MSGKCSQADGHDLPPRGSLNADNFKIEDYPDLSPEEALRRSLAREVEFIESIAFWERLGRVL
ncbi:MAG: hypothetical protein HQL34_05000 [Alphaproteobacteria bacterium]|nr:hypothetical protein [Alphaproteobacteria bacterium]